MLLEDKTMKKIENLPNSGVDYITKNNKEEQKKTKYASGEAVSFGQDSVLKVNSFSGVSSLEDPTREENFSSQEVIRSSTPLTQSDVLRCVVQMWDNGEESRQRSKLKVRLNLVDGTDADFIAPLTKDVRNFMKHTADKDLARDWKNQSSKFVKDRFNVKPWLGKFHEVQQAYTSKYHKQTVEPNCFATVWWDDEAKDWSATLILYDFAIEELDLQSRNVTDKQRAQGCRSSRIWINPEHDKQQRPLTWAERRALGK
jgi:hypothetical protein